MIYDIVRNFGMYCPVFDRFTDAAAFLKAADCASLPVGRQTISSNGAVKKLVTNVPVSLPGVR